MHRIGTVLELWRYPVKSMRGERLETLALDPEGIRGDRRFAIASTAAPAGKPLLSSRERTAMLRYQPTLQPTPAVRTPSGHRYPLPSTELTAALQQTLATPGASLHLEASPDQPLTDVRPVSLISAATLRALTEELGRIVDPQRFRSNLILALDTDEPFAEDSLTGAALRFGADHGPKLRILERIPRCRIVSLDPDTTEPDPDLLRHLARVHDGRIGIYASVLRPGMLSVGDAVFRAKTSP